MNCACVYDLANLWACPSPATELSWRHVVLEMLSKIARRLLRQQTGLTRVRLLASKRKTVVMLNYSPLPYSLFIQLQEWLLALWASVSVFAVSLG